MIVGGTLAVVAGASSAFVGRTPGPAEIAARGQIVVRPVEALALCGCGRRLRIGVARVTISIGRERAPHDRDRKQSGHHDLTHRHPLSAQSPTASNTRAESSIPLPHLEN